MKKNILTFGLILGVILSINGFIAVNMIMDNPNIETNDVLGYTIMIVIFSLIFFGIRNYRNKQLNGTITLGKAFKAGALIALVGSTLYVVMWLFYYYLFVPEFLDKYTECVINGITRDGATTAEITAKTEEMSQFAEMYENPLFVIMVSYFEVLPIGLIVALISSLILKRKPKEPAVS